MNTINYFIKLEACTPALQWIEDQPDQSLAALWATCPRGDWLAWYLGRLGEVAGHGSPEHRRAVLVACLCARTVSHRAGGWAEEMGTLLSRVEAWAHGENADLTAVTSRVSEIRGHATSLVDRGLLLGAEVAAIDAIAAVFDALGDTAIDNDVASAVVDDDSYVAAFASTTALYAAYIDDLTAICAPNSVDTARYVKALADLADLIRAAVPQIGEPHD